jgi:hypothetical protein
MRKSNCFLTAILMAVLFSTSAFAQSVTITGNVKNGATKENIPAVSVLVKGSAVEPILTRMVISVSKLISYPLPLLLAQLVLNHKRLM